MPVPASTDPPVKPIPVVIDTDLDVSDVAAVALLLLDPRVDVRAMTVTDGGTGITNCGAGRTFMGYLLEQLGREDVPHACGGAEPGADALLFPPEWRTPADSGWGIEVPPRPQTDTPESAVDLLARTITGRTEPTTIIALGPWTNIAAAATADSTLAGRVAGIHAMAGSVDSPGNVFVDGLTAEDRLEWNVAADPSAFAEVFDLGIPLALVPLDATDDVPVRPSLLERLAEAKSAGANLVYELMVRVPGRIGEGQQLWDELAAMAFVELGTVTWEEMRLSVRPNGRLDRDDAGRVVRVATAADAAATESALVDLLSRGPERRTPFALEGEVAVTWDGVTCTADAGEAPAAGMARLTFTNHDDGPAGAFLAGVEAPHTWAEVEALVRSVDSETAEAPDWIRVGGFASDEAGTHEPVLGTVSLEPGTFGPICVTGTWPEARYAAGAPFVVAEGHP
jgi:inosine-uridine nucleoside N-ribohydrolase